MALIDFQRALGLMVMQGSKPNLRLPANLHLSDAEKQSIVALHETAGLKLTSDIQLSWARGRPLLAAPLTLSLIDPTARARIIDEWISSRASASMFDASLAMDFLKYLAGRLPSPSHALSICLFERAVRKAELGMLTSSKGNAVQPIDPRMFVKAGRYASLVAFHANPDLLLNAVMSGTPLPAVESRVRYLLFAPRLAGLFGIADEADAAIWRMVEKPTAISWLRHKWSKKPFDAFLRQGIIEAVDCRT